MMGLGLSVTRRAARVAEASFRTVQEMLSSNLGRRGEGSIWNAGGYRYEEAASDASDHHLTTAGGVKLYVLPGDSGYSVMAFGAKGDGETDDIDAFKSVAACCRLKGGQMVVPAGDYLLTDGIPVGAPFAVIGEGRCSTLRPSFETPTYIFDFNASANFKSISGLCVVGPGRYSANEMFLRNTSGWNAVFEDITLTNLGGGLNIINGWANSIRRIRTMYVSNPISVTIPNGTVIADSYVQRFRGIAVDLTSGLAPHIRNMICEYGEASDGSAGGTAIRLRACQSWEIDGYYTEGGTATDLHLSFINQRACLNGSLRNAWLNSGGSRLIWAESVRGAALENITIQTPQGEALIDFTGRAYSDGFVDVGYVAQVDQNSGSFLGDRRGDGQTLIPLSTDNRLIRLMKGHPKVGSDVPPSNDDVQNIANHTMPDANGVRPRLARSPRLSLAASPDGLTATSSTTQSTFGTESSGVYLHASDYGSCVLRVTGTMSASSSASFLTTNVRLTNAALGEALSSGNFNVSNAPAEITREFYVNVAPGRTLVTLALTRAQGGGGSNTFTVTDIAVE